MILVDTNLLVYAAASGRPQHEAAREWLDEALSSPGRVALPWESLVGFVRIVTNPRIFSTPVAAPAARDVVSAWLAAPAAWVPVPLPDHWAVLSRFLDLGGVRGGVVHDAHLAALAVTHGLVVASTESDFGRFPGVRWSNPLAGTGA